MITLVLVLRQFMNLLLPSVLKCFTDFCRLWLPIKDECNFNEISWNINLWYLHVLTIHAPGWEAHKSEFWIFFCSFVCFLNLEPVLSTWFTQFEIVSSWLFIFIFCQIRSTFSVNELLNFSLVTSELSPVNSSDLFVNPLTKDLTFQSFVVEDVQNKILYWKLPQEYTGNKVGLQRHL